MVARFDNSILHSEFGCRSSSSSFASERRSKRRSDKIVDCEEDCNEEYGGRRISIIASSTHTQYYYTSTNDRLTLLVFKCNGVESLLRIPWNGQLNWKSLSKWHHFANHSRSNFSGLRAAPPSCHHRTHDGGRRGAVLFLLDSSGGSGNHAWSFDLYHGGGDCWISCPLVRGITSRIQISGFQRW